MATLAYDQTGGFQSWYDELVKIITDDQSESAFAAVVKKWNEYCKDAADASIFTGPAAQDNFEKFKEVNDAFSKFFNDFANELNDIGQKVTDSIRTLEEAASITGGIEVPNFTKINFDDLAALDYTLTDEKIIYDPEAVSDLAGNIGGLNEVLESAQSALTKQLSQLNTGDKIWDGDYAASYVQAVTDCLDSNIPKIKEDVEGVSKHCANIAEAARATDSTQVSAS